MTDHPLVSIIIPTFNREKTVADAIDSALQQDWPKVEVIVVDDGSTDDTDKLIKTKCASDWNQSNVNYIRNANQGAAAARNVGFAHSTGRYVQFLDSDDLLDRNKLSLQMEALLQDTSTIDFCTCYGRMTGASQEDSERIGFLTDSKRELMLRLISRNVHSMCTIAPLWRRELLESTAGWNETISLGDDLEYYLRLVSLSKHFSNVPNSLFTVRSVSQDRLSTAQSSSSLNSATQTMILNQATIAEAGYWDQEFQATLLGKARTLYANLLDQGSKKDIDAFEQILLRWAKDPAVDVAIHVAIYLRKAFGSNLLLAIHRTISGLRAL